MPQDFRVRPFSPLLFLVFPGLVLFWIAVFPPHGFDLALSHLFYGEEGFAMNRAPVMLFFHKISRIVPFAFGFAGLYVAIQNWRHKPYYRNAPRIETRRALYLMAAMLASVFIVKFLKNTTGVFCPVNITEFGGTAPLNSPGWSLSTRPGHCWPSGFAGTGFCLFALYFAFRDVSKRLARYGLIAAFGVGGFCSVLQVMRGEHFFTHVLGTCLVDWLACAIAYCLFFAPEILALARGKLARKPAVRKAGREGEEFSGLPEESARGRA